MIDGDLFVFDSAIHVHDLSNENVRDDVTEATYVRDHMLSAPVKARPDAFEGMPDPARPTVEDAYRTIFANSGTDMAMAQVVPLFDWYKNFFAPVELQAAM